MSAVKHERFKETDFNKLPIVGEQPKSEKEDKFLREICEFEFYNLEEPGVSHRFAYGDARNQNTFTFFHGAKYRLPRFIARHLENVSTPIWDWRPDGTGRMDKKLVGKKPRFRMSQTFS